MKILLDTHIALCAAQGARQLSAHARAILERDDPTPFVSAAAIWEIAIQHARGNLPLHPRVRHSSWQVSSNWR